MGEREEVVETAVAKPSAQGEVVTLRREVARLTSELASLRERDVAARGVERTRTLEAVGRLAGGVAHDFDNLIGSLLESIEVARRTHAPAEREAALERSVGIARDASRITKQLLTFAGEGVGGDEVVDLALETRRSLVILRRLVGDDIDVRVDAPGEPVWVHLERAQLTQILLNLMVNARDAMPRGGRLSIDVRPLERPTRLDGRVEKGAMLRVADTGVGIAPADLGRIFDPFFTTKLPGRGAGLGLAAVFGIVVGSGGEIDVSSDEGRGTAFELWFRAAAPPANAARRLRSSPRVEAVGPAARPAAETILVVEDNASLAETCVAIFSGAGYRVLVARDGAAALELLASEPNVGTVLSDVVMPRLSGIELARTLAKSHPELRVVLWSGYPQELSMDALHEGAASSGGCSNVVCVLPKPVEASTLLEAIAKARG